MIPCVINSLHKQNANQISLQIRHEIKSIYNVSRGDVSQRIIGAKYLNKICIAFSAIMCYTTMAHMHMSLFLYCIKMAYAALYTVLMYI